jgi:SDR family mycofactocin-dependent oxidoreductase
LSDPRVALVTGAGRGIGAATARRLAAGGWRLVLLDAPGVLPGADYEMASAAELEATAAACGGPERARFLTGDVRRQDDLDDAVALATEAFGGLDAALAVAGCVGGGGAEAWETSEEAWALALEVNLTGVWRLANAAVPALLARPEPRSGRFLAVASAGGTRGLPRLAGYTAAKHGVIGLVRALAAELGPHGITANAVAPGSTRTATLTASAAVYGLADEEEFAVHHRLPRLLDPDEIAAALAWLSGPDAAAITGAVLAVDAGMTC